MMRNKVLVLSCCLALLFCFGAVSLTGAAEAEPKVGQVIGPVKFAKPLSDDDAKYLGLPKAEEFTIIDTKRYVLQEPFKPEDGAKLLGLNTVKAPYVLVEQFNTSCPHCMAQAPVMNKLFDMVQKDAQLKDKLKFIGAGQGNEEPQLKMWKAFHKVAFPLVPDPNNTFGKALNFTPYPVTVILDKTGKVVFVHIGAFENADEVLGKIKAVVK